MDAGALEIRFETIQTLLEAASPPASPPLLPPPPGASRELTRPRRPEAWAAGCRGYGGEVAERNEEINRRRMGAARAGAAGGGPLKVTDPAALARLMADMRAKAEQQRAAEEAREAERRRREGSAYLPPEQRAEAARAAKQAAAEGHEARVLEKKFDPSKDYYELLGIARSASAAEVRKSYKKLALYYHPDKHKAADAEQQAAIADKFKQVVEAYDVLSDEEKRAVYDKCRTHLEANPGRGLPVLSPEEAAMMRSGAAELARLRRMGAKATKHPALEKEVFVSLEKLNSGGTKTMVVERRRVRPDGAEFMSTKNIHLVIRKGSREGDRLVFEGDGEETVDTLPGDLAVTLRCKPHLLFRRAGPKDLELFANRQLAEGLQAGDMLFAVEVPTIHGKHRLLVGSAFREAAANGGSGGVWQTVLPGQGLFDAVDPWEQPAGSLTVQLRYPPWLLEEADVRCSLRPQPVHLLGSGGDRVAAALAAGSLAGMLNHGREAEEMVNGDRPCISRALTAVCLVVGPPDAARDLEHSWHGGSMAAWCIDSGASSSSTSSVSGSATPTSSRSDRLGGDAAAAISPAAQAMLQVLRHSVPGLQTTTLGSGWLLDEEWGVLDHADAIILDWRCQQDQQEAQEHATGAAGGTDAVAEEQEQLLAAAAQQLAQTGVLELVWQRFWAGCLIAGVGQACALLGRQPGTCAGGTSSSLAPVLPWYAVRAGGGTSGWAALHAALQAEVPQAAGSACSSSGPAGPAATEAEPAVTVGVLAGGCWLAHPTSGHAEMLVAPGREALVATAAWSAAHDPDDAGLQEADEDWGYFRALCSQD